VTFLQPTCIRRPVSGPCTNIVSTFGTQKLEWWLYQVVKKFENILYVKFKAAYWPFYWNFAWGSS